MIKSFCVKFGTGIAFLLLMAGSVQAQQGEPIGLMLSTIGAVTAEDENGNVRSLQRRSPVFEGDTVITADRARAQIRFNDRGLVALQPGTSFYIEQHQFNGQQDGSESAVYSLLRGGLQAITGLIGHTNRENYRVSTPLATIGLRGTHWAATFCSTACDGNPPGLYGGVADGGIDVCNGGGCTAIGANTYFYTPDANTRPQTLLAPPSVVFADAGVAADEDENLAAGGDDEAADDSQDTVSDVAAFVARNQDESGNLTLPGAGSNQNRPDSDQDDALAQRNEDEVSNLVTRDTPTEAAGQGSVVALASAQSNPANASQAQAVNILLQPSGTTSLPRAALVEPVVVPADAAQGTEAETTVALAALDFNLGQIGCDPCLYATAGVQGTQAELVEYRAIDLGDVEVYLGRWQGQALLSAGANRLNALNDHHYAIALDANRSALSDQAQSVQPSAFSFDAPANAFIARYNLLDGTAPTDALGNVGTLQSARLDLDFAQQLITYMDISLLFGDQRSVVASLSQPMLLPEDAFAGLFLPLVGECTGGSCGSSVGLEGSTSLSFLGSSGSHLMGVYALDDFSNFSQTFFGTYLLGQDEFIDPYEVDLSALSPTLAPEGAIASVASILDSGTGYLPAHTVTGTADGNRIHLLDVYDSRNSLVGQEFGSNLYRMNSGRLAEFGQFSSGGNNIYFGRWESADTSLELDGTVESITGPSVYVYADAAFQVPTFAKPTVIHYALADGPAPVDHNGDLGTLNSLDITLDFYYQTIDRFDINASAGGNSLTAGLTSPAPLVSGISEFFLRGDCSGAGCSNSLFLAGNGSLLIGDSTANSLFGTYGLYAVGLQAAAPGETSFVDGGLFDIGVSEGGINALAGAYVATASELAFHPDYVENPLIQSTPGIAAVAAIEQLTGGSRAIGTTASSEEANIGTLTVDDAMNALVSLRSNDEGCLDCGFDLISGVLIEDMLLEDVGGVAGLDLYLGTWGDASFSYSQDIATGNLLDIAHYAFSSSPTILGEVPEFPVSAPLLQYSLAGATAATDSTGQRGTLESATMELDLIRQLVTQFGLDIIIGDAQLVASLYQPVLIDDALSDGIRLVGSCAGAECVGSNLIGESSIGLVGPAAEAVIGHYGLIEYSGSLSSESSLEDLLSNYSVAGVFALERGAAVQNPFWFEGGQTLLASSAGQPFAFAGHLDDSGDLYAFTRGFEADADNQFFTLDGTTKVWAYELNQLDLGMLFSDGFCYYCDDDFDPLAFAFGEYGQYSEQVSIDETLGALLVEYGDSSGAGYSAHYGRWLAPDGFAVDVSGNLIPTGTDAHYIWATSAPTAAEHIATPSLVRYSLAGGTRPTNEFGLAGNLHSVNLDLDLFQQALTRFDMAFDIGERFYSAGLRPWDTTLQLDGGVGGGIDLIGKCKFEACGEGVSLQGQVNLSFVGNALETDQLLAFEGVIGSFALETQEFEANPFDLLGEQAALAIAVSSELPGDMPYVSAAGTFHLTQQSGTDHPNYLDAAASGGPTVESVDGLAAFALGKAFECYYESCFRGWQHIVQADQSNTDSGESISVVSVNGAANQVISFLDESQEGSLLQQRLFNFGEGVLAEQGGFADFLGENSLPGSDQFGVNWGRWVSMSTVTELQFDLTDPLNPVPTGAPFSSEAAASQHFIFTDAPVGDFPTFNDPTQLLYTYVGGPAPTTASGSTGTMYAELAIDLYTQRLTDFDLTARVEDRAYVAQMYQVNPQAAGMPLDQLFEQNFIQLQGQCAGGDCSWFDTGEFIYGGGLVSTDLIGFASLAPFGNNLEGFLGTFELSPGSTEQFDSYYGWVDDTFDGPDIWEYLDSVYLQGGFVLANTDSRTNPFWTVNPSSTLAAAPSVGLITGTTRNTNGMPYQPFVDLINPAESGAELRLDQIEGFDQIIAAATNPAIDCFTCQFAVADAVLVDGSYAYHPYNYLSDPAQVFWGMWSHRDQSGNQWLFDGSGSAIDAAGLTSFIFADQLTPSSTLASLSPLTSSSSYANYYFSGGPAPVNEYGDLGWVDFMSASVNFDTQMLDYFSSSLKFADGREIYLHTASGTPIASEFDALLAGDCYGCGALAGDYEVLEGVARLAFVGGQGEQLIGGLQAYSNGANLTPAGSYSVQAGFVLNQEFNDHWVNNPQGEPAPQGSAVTFVGATSTGDALQTAFYVGDNGSTADMHNLMSHTHDHQNSLIGFNAVGDALCGDCAWEIVSGELNDYWSTTEYGDDGDMPDIYWGRWMPSESNALSDGTALALEGWQHFAWSPEATSYLDAVFADAVAGDIATYSVYDNTMTSGFNLSSGNPNFPSFAGANMTVDLYAQQITAYNLAIYTNGFNYLHQAGLADGPVSLDANSPSANLVLAGDFIDNSVGSSVPGSVSGNASVMLVGSAAEAALSTYHLMSSQTMDSFSGAIIFARDSEYYGGD